MPIPEPLRHSIRNVKGRSCKSYGTSSFGTMTFLITEFADLPSISESISHHRNSLFNHVARLQENVPAHKALDCHVNLSLSLTSTK